MWFRRDLRLADNRALLAAAAGGRTVLPVYVHDDEDAGAWRPGGASRWWLHHSLEQLSRDLSQKGSGLILRRGPAVEALLKLAAETGASSIHFCRCYESHAVAVESDLKTACDAAGISLHRHAGNLLFEPEALRTRSGQPFRVFSPFWRAALEAEPPRSPLPAPRHLARPQRWPQSDRLDEYELRPVKPDWALGLHQSWKPGEAGAAQRLSSFIDRQVSQYAGKRDRPDLSATSRLSPHLHFGELSPTQAWHAAAMARDLQQDARQGVDSFLRELGWREFSYHLLFHWPEITDRPFRPEFDNFPWQDPSGSTRTLVDAWKRGRTGYPIIDAGMRQLWQTGWMHNRVRMIAASFLTKHLRVSWQIGANWFWDTLVDADLANNSASWQWVAGSGADAAPYFRIFNPELQGIKFDPDGAYVRSFVPELAEMPAPLIHAPWKASEHLRRTAGVVLGQTYPFPIVDHADARQAALAAHQHVKAASTL